MPIEKWMSDFLISMSLMLVKYHAKAQEFIKYMQDISMAAERSSKNATTSYIKKKTLLSRKKYPSSRQENEELCRPETKSRQIKIKYGNRGIIRHRTCKQI